LLTKTKETIKILPFISFFVYFGVINLFITTGFLLVLFHHEFHFSIF